MSIFMSMILDLMRHSIRAYRCDHRRWPPPTSVDPERQFAEGYRGRPNGRTVRCPQI